MSDDSWTIEETADGVTIRDENGLTVATLGPTAGPRDARTILAGIKALGACRALARANNWGEVNGETDWDDIGVAIEAAHDALKANGEHPESLGIVTCHACEALNRQGRANCVECDAHLMGSEQPGNGDDEGEG